MQSTTFFLLQNQWLKQSNRKEKEFLNWLKIQENIKLVNIIFNIYSRQLRLKLTELKRNVTESVKKTLKFTVMTVSGFIVKNVQQKITK